MVSLDQISVALEHPLTLLLVGAGVSGLLVSWLSNRWENRRKELEIKVEDRRKELEIKVDIASRMTEVIAHYRANAAIYLFRKKKTFTDAEIDAYYEDVKQWVTARQIMSSKLESYFSETGIRKRWDDYCDLLVAFTSATRQYFLEPMEEDTNDRLKFNLERIKNALSDNTQVDWNQLTTKMIYDEDLWGSVDMLVLERGDIIIKDVLKLPIKVF